MSLLSNTKQALVAIVHSPLVAPWLPPNYLKVITQCVLRAHPTQRGFWAGVDACRTQSNKCYPRYALINAQSVLTKGGRVLDLILHSNLDIMAVTETLLSTNEELLSICPDGFTAVLGEDQQKVRELLPFTEIRSDLPSARIPPSPRLNTWMYLFP